MSQVMRFKLGECHNIIWKFNNIRWYYIKKILFFMLFQINKPIKSNCEVIFIYQSGMK